MIKLEQIALELLEYKQAEIEAGHDAKAGSVNVWDLHHFLEQEFAMLTADEQLRLEAASSSLKRHAVAPSKPKTALDTFDALVLDSFAGFEGLSKTSQATLGNETLLLDNTNDGSSETTVNKSFPAGSLDFDFNLDDLNDFKGASELSDFAGFAMNDTPLLLTDNPDHKEEQQSLQSLASKVWWHNMEEIIQQLAIRCRVEKDRSMARLLYALTRNLERYIEKTDLDLENLQPKVLIAITDYDDPLVSFGNLETLNVLVRDVVEIIMNLGIKGSLYEDAQLSKERTLEFVKRMANAIVQDPYIGKHSSIASKGPSSDQIRIAIQELAKEQMRDAQRNKQQLELEARLQATLMQEKRMENLFQQDVAKFSNAAQVFFERLEPYLPKRVGGAANDPSLSGGVLFAENPVLSLSKVPTEASSLNVRLTGPLRFIFAGNEIGLSPLDGSILVLVNNKEYMLSDTIKVPLDKQTLYGFCEKNYVHLMIQDESSSLAVRLAESLAILFILGSDYKESLLSTLKTAATLSMGDSQTLIANAIRRLRELSANAPSRRQALEGLIKGAAKANGINLPDNVFMSLVQRLITAMTVSPDELTVILESADHNEAFVHKLADDPISMNINGQATTIRKYRVKSSSESIVVMLPGRIIGSFVNSLLIPFPGGTLLCARSEDELAVLYFERIHIVNQVQ